MGSKNTDSGLIPDNIEAWLAYPLFTERVYGSGSPTGNMLTILVANTIDSLYENTYS